jgi:hypothetical protein
VNGSEVSIVDIASIVIALLAMIVSISSLLNAQKRTAGNVLLGCLSSYLEIAKNKDSALIENKPHYARLYYRGLLDLLWSEYRMYQTKLIPKHVMRAWARSTFRNLQHGNVEVVSSGVEPRKVTYMEVWQDLKANNYFDEEDSFMKFMEYIEKGEIDKALDITDNSSWIAKLMNI